MPETRRAAGHVLGVLAADGTFSVTLARAGVTENLYGPHHLQQVATPAGTSLADIEANLLRR